MKAAIFDIDGTLVDSVDFHTEAWQRTLAHFGHDIEFAKIRAQIGKGGDQLLPVFLSKEEFEKRGDEMDEFRGKLFQKDYLSQVAAFPQVRALFERILADGWKIALASSAKQSELKTYKKVADINDLLEAETSSDDAEKSKPHPDIFEAAMHKLGKIPPQECVVIGDSPYDAEAAAKAGIRSIGFLCGGFSKADLEKAGYEAIYQGAGDLLASYEKSLFYRERPGRA